MIQNEGLPTADTPADSIIEWAVQTTTGQCMVEAGFTFIVQGWASSTSGKADRMFGTDDVEWARENGLGIGRVPTDGTKTGPNANEAYHQTLDEARRRAYDIALMGDGTNPLTVSIGGGGSVSMPSTGCLTHGRNFIYGDAPRWFALDFQRQDRTKLAFEEVRASPAYEQRLGEWRSCMAAAGFRFDSQASMRDAVAQRYEDRSLVTDAWDHEVAVAVADAECAASAGLVTNAENLFQAALGRIEAAEQHSVNEFKALKSQALQRAAALLDSMQSH